MNLKNIFKKFFSFTHFFEGERPSIRWEDMPRAIGSKDDIIERANTRELFISAARNICNLFGVANKALNTYANYSIGDMKIHWNTSDNQWNSEAERLWDIQSKVIDARGVNDFRNICRLAIISMLRDGDIFFTKIKRPDGFILLEPIEADRVGVRVLTPNEPNIYGGVEVDPKTSRPINYYIATRGRYGIFLNNNIVPAQYIIHFYDSDRFDSHRGISAFSKGSLARARTLRELIRAEEIGVLTANKFSVAIKANSGHSIMPSNSDLLMDNNIASAPQTIREKPNIFELYDGTVLTLEPGEDIQTIQNNRPSSTWQGFVEFLIKDIAVSLDLPYEFVWNMSGLVGPSVRLTIKQAERTFKNTFYLLEKKFVRQVISFFIANAMDKGLIKFNPEFFKFIVQQPEFPTIDVGRESKASIDEWERGLLSGLEIAKERGMDIYETMEQKAKEVAFAKQMAQKYGIDYKEIIYGGGGQKLTEQNNTSNNEKQN